MALHFKVAKYKRCKGTYDAVEVSRLHRLQFSDDFDRPLGVAM